MKKMPAIPPMIRPSPLSMSSGLPPCKSAACRAICSRKFHCVTKTAIRMKARPSPPSTWRPNSSSCTCSMPPWPTWPWTPKRRPRPWTCFPPEDGHRPLIIIDPIDGTLNYYRGSDDYAVMAALCREELYQAAVVYFPAPHTMYWTTGDGALSPGRQRQSPAMRHGAAAGQPPAGLALCGAQTAPPSGGGRIQHRDFPLFGGRRPGAGQRQGIGGNKFPARPSGRHRLSHNHCRGRHGYDR